MPAVPSTLPRAPHQNNFVTDQTNVTYAQTSVPYTTVPSMLNFQIGDSQYHLKDSLRITNSQQPSTQTSNNTQFSKPFNGAHFLQAKDPNKQAISELAASLAEEKHSDPLMISTPVTYQDGGQPSPASSTQSITTQVMRFQSSEGVSDAMLSAINYSDSDILPDNSFEVQSNLSVDDTLLNMRNTMNTPSGSAFGDLFDGDSNMGDYNMEGQQDLSLSPQSFSGLTDSASLNLEQESHTGTSHLIILALKSILHLDNIIIS